MHDLNIFPNFISTNRPLIFSQIFCSIYCLKYINFGLFILETLTKVDFAIYIEIA